MTVLHLPIGIQGSGKSVLTTYLREDKAGTVIEPDMFRLIITGENYHKEAEDIIWAHVKTTLRVLLGTGQNVILDATNTSKYIRSQWMALARNPFPNSGAQVKVFGHMVLTPLETAIERDSSRKHPVGEEVIRRYAKDFVFPSLDEGFERLYIYNAMQQQIDFVEKKKPLRDDSPYMNLVAQGKNPYAHPEVIKTLNETTTY
jgi:predicted kinase